MTNCDCNLCGQGIVPATVCCKKKEKEPPVKLATVNYPAQYGTDADGQPYAPQYGKFTNTIVTYAANNARYIYDGQGEYTKIISDDQFNALEQKLTALLNEETEARQSDVENLQTNINQLANKEAEDVENLQTNINAEVNARLALAEGLAEETAAREEADEALSTRIDEVINSPDVRYIVESYADLEAIDKATVGDQDYARVLVDETHDGQSTFYQFNKTGNDWTYVGAAGAYYTKTEVDGMVDSLEEQLHELGGSGKLAALLNTNVELQALDPTALIEGQVAIVLADETHDGTTTYYEVGEQTIGGESSQENNILVGNTAAFYNDPTDRYWDWSSNAEKAILEFSKKTNPAGTGKITLIIARKDLVSAFDVANKDYSIQISSLSDNSPASIYFRGPKGNLEVPTDGTNVNLDSTAKNQLWYTLDSNSELAISINPTDFPNGAKLNIRLYEGLNHPQPITEGGEPILAWIYKGETAVEPMQLKTINGESLIGEGNIEISGGGGSVDLLSAYSSSATATQAYNAPYINSQLNSYKIAIGQDAATPNNYTGAIALGKSSSAGAGEVVALGQNANVTANASIAIGAYANSTFANSVALGRKATNTREDEVSIGGIDSGLNRVRYLANVRAGELDTDAVNVAQLNATVGNIQDVLDTLNTGTGV